MGSFSLTPLYNHYYKAVIKTASGETMVKDLPKVYAKRLCYDLTDSADKIKIIVQSDILAPREIYLLAHTREIIKVAGSSFPAKWKSHFSF